MNRIIRIGLLAAMTILCAKSINAQESSMRINFETFDKDQSYLEIGVALAATDTFDMMDQEQPPFPPPGGMMPVIALNDGFDSNGDQMTTLVNVDFRAGEYDMVLEKTYQFTILGSFSVTPWRMFWGLAPDELLSATLRDVYIPDTYQYEVDLKTEAELIVDKPIATWEIVTEWNLGLASFEDENLDLDGKKSPFTAAGDVLEYQQQTEVKIYGINGSIVFESTTNQVDMSRFNKGAYIIVSSHSGNKYIDKYIR